MLHLTLLFLTAIAASASAPLGCSIGHGCTDVGCTDGFNVLVSPEGASPFTPGVYVFDFQIDDARTRIVCSISSTPPESSHCDGAMVSPAIGQGGIVEFLVGVPTTPRAVSLTVTIPDGRTTTASWTPSYSINQPNGASCGPTCQQANASMSIPG